MVVDIDANDYKISSMPSSDDFEASPPMTTDRWRTIKQIFPEGHSEMTSLGNFMLNTFSDQIQIHY